MRFVNPQRVFAALVLLLGTTGLAAQTADSAQVTKLLADAKAQAASAANDAELLQSYTRSTLSLESHASQIEKIRTHVNDLGRTVSEMKAARGVASNWQQQAIDRIDPLLQEMADSLSTTIKHMNDNPSRIHMQPYRDYAAATYDFANRTAEVIRDFVEYGKVKGRVAELEQKLEIDPNRAGE